jgi:hypothetical protein
MIGVTARGVPVSMEDSHEFIRHLDLAPSEAVLVATTTERALVALTERRFIVREADRVALDLAIEDIRRVQFDVERGRPATFAIVPHSPMKEPQVLAVPIERLDAVSRIIAIMGQRLGVLD